jgi:hypothetical protein
MEALSNRDKIHLYYLRLAKQKAVQPRAKENATGGLQASRLLCRALFFSNLASPNTPRGAGKFALTFTRGRYPIMTDVSALFRYRRNHGYTFTN